MNLQIMIEQTRLVLLPMLLWGLWTLRCALRKKVAARLKTRILIQEQIQQPSSANNSCSRSAS